MPLEYLATLNQTHLPKIVTSRRDLKHVSLLKATGLIEAKFAIWDHSPKSFGKVAAALIVFITPDGRAEIEATVGPCSNYGFGFPDKDDLAIEYLRFIEYCDLPKRVEERFEIESIKTLMRTGLICATIESADSAGAEFEKDRAIILYITEAGIDLLSK